MKPLVLVDPLIPSPGELMRRFGLSRDAARMKHQDMLATRYYRNDRYQVAVRRLNTEHGEVTHLSIKRLDRLPVHKWRDLQEIKNQLLGPEVEAVELYPAESRRIDSANQYHLWALPEGQVFHIGFFPQTEGAEIQQADVEAKD